MKVELVRKEREIDLQTKEIQVREKQYDAEVKKKAEADRYAVEQAAEAEAKEKLAEAFQKFGEAAVLDIIVKMLPELAGRIAEPIASIDKLTIVDTGKGEGAARVSNYVTELMSTAPEMLKSVSGIDVEQLIKGLTTRKNGLQPVPSSGETAHSCPD
jgi:flotillin